jgi:hypothetical protein
MPTHSARGRPEPALRSGWTPINIALMVLGFIFFWPLGLLMLAWILWGDQMTRLFEDTKTNLRANFSAMNDPMPFRIQSNTGNVAFDEYRQQELKRLEEERRKLDEMRAEFDLYMRELRRARDREEFERFMEEHRRHKGEA